MILGILVWIAVVSAERYVVQLAGNASVGALGKRYSFRTGGGPGSVEVVDLGERFRALVGEFSAVDLEKFFYDGEVVSISIDRELELQDYVGGKGSAGRPNWLKSIRQRAGSRTGVDVYIFDTGVDFKHPGLRKTSMVKLADFAATPVPKGCDPHGHGTAVAGLVASETFGVLKRCNLVDVRVADKDGKVTLSRLLKALRAGAMHAQSSRRPAVFAIPILLGMKNYIFESAIESVSEDIAIVLPAGDQHAEACDFSPLASKPRRNVLVVGSLDDDGHLAKFSNHGDCVDVYAPGTNFATLRTTDGGNEVLLRDVTGTSASFALGAAVVGHYMSMGLTSAEAIQKIRSDSQDIYTRVGQLRALQLDPRVSI